MKKLIILFLFAMTAHAQEQVAASILQDLRHATVGDGYYKPFTPNVLVRFKMEGNQQTHGFMVIYPEWEYAELNGIYKRYTANGGYVLNRLVVDRAAVGVFASIGFTDRWGGSWLTYGANLELSYQLGRRLKAVALYQIVNRPDLKARYNTQGLKYSFFVGLEWVLN